MALSTNFSLAVKFAGRTFSNSEVQKGHSTADQWIHWTELLNWSEKIKFREKLLLFLHGTFWWNILRPETGIFHNFIGQTEGKANIRRFYFSQVNRWSSMFSPWTASGCITAKFCALVFQMQRKKNTSNTLRFAPHTCKCMCHRLFFIELGMFRNTCKSFNGIETHTIQLQ